MSTDDYPERAELAAVLLLVMSHMPQHRHMAERMRRAAERLSRAAGEHEREVEEP